MQDYHPRDWWTDGAPIPEHKWAHKEEYVGFFPYFKNEFES